jgi:hypothetical protein
VAVALGPGPAARGGGASLPAAGLLAGNFFFFFDLDEKKSEKKCPRDVIHIAIKGSRGGRFFTSNCALFPRKTIVFLSSFPPLFSPFFRKKR